MACDRPAPLAPLISIALPASRASLQSDAFLA